MNHSKELNMTMTFEHSEGGHSLLSYSSLASNDVVNLQNEDLGGTRM